MLAFSEPRQPLNHDFWVFSLGEFILEAPGHEDYLNEHDDMKQIRLSDRIRDLYRGIYSVFEILILNFFSLFI